MDLKQSFVHVGLVASENVEKMRFALLLFSNLFRLIIYVSFMGYLGGLKLHACRFWYLVFLVVTSSELKDRKILFAFELSFTQLVYIRLNYFKYGKERDSPSYVRSTLLVIAMLMAAATFQAGLNQPGGIWQDDLNGPDARIDSHISGKSVLGFHN
ncbi:PGG domain [Dillenia turbinata]|uniref:PGG domain n=1 Tax=Dillenia turbinata TaxID=194707 RepID=A0AAN8URH8_9MAGN